jgi:hypothetical protein
MANGFQKVIVRMAIFKRWEISEMLNVLFENSDRLMIQDQWLSFNFGQHFLKEEELSR